LLKGLLGELVFSHPGSVYSAEGSVYVSGRRRYRVYRGSNERSEVVVIWQDTKRWTQADLERDNQFVLERKRTEGADEVYANGDSFIPGQRALDPVFKRLMFSEVQT